MRHSQMMWSEVLLRGLLDLEFSRAMIKLVLRWWEKGAGTGCPQLLTCSLAVAPWQVLYILPAFLIPDVSRGYGRSSSALRKKSPKYKVLRINSWKALNSLGISAEQPPRGLPAVVWSPPSVCLWIPGWLKRMEMLRESEFGDSAWAPWSLSVELLLWAGEFKCDPWKMCSHWDHVRTKLL